jgi:hypothetical protein
MWKSRQALSGLLIPWRLYFNEQAMFSALVNLCLRRWNRHSKRQELSQAWKGIVESERQYLLDRWKKNICPKCGAKIPPGKRVGSGKKSEGGFCSLDCYGKYHEAALAKRAREVQSKARRKVN